MTILFVFILWALQSGRLADYVGLVVGPYEPPVRAQGGGGSEDSGGGWIDNLINRAIGSVTGGQNLGSPSGGGAWKNPDAGGPPAGSKPVEGLPWLK